MEKPLYPLIVEMTKEFGKSFAKETGKGIMEVIKKANEYATKKKK